MVAIAHAVAAWTYSAQALRTIPLFGFSQASDMKRRKRVGDVIIGAPWSGLASAGDRECNCTEPVRGERGQQRSELL